MGSRRTVRIMKNRMVRRIAKALAFGMVFVAACTRAPEQQAAPSQAENVLPRPEQPFKGHIGRTTKDSAKDFPQAVEAPEGRAERPAHPDRRRRLRRLAHVRRADSRRRRWIGWPKNGLRYTQFHTTALCSPTRAALLTGRNHHSAATGIIMEAGTGFPGYNTLMPKSCRHVRRGAQAERLQHRLVRQEPQRARLADQPGRAVRPVADRAGLRVLLRLHRRRHQPVAPGDLREHQARSSRRTTTRTTSSTRTWPTRRSSGSACSTPSRRTSRSSPTTRRARRTPRTTRRRSGSPSSRASSTRAGTRCARRRSRGRSSWASSRRTPS